MGREGGSSRRDASDAARLIECKVLSFEALALIYQSDNK